MGFRFALGRDTGRVLMSASFRILALVPSNLSQLYPGGGICHCNCRWPRITGKAEADGPACDFLPSDVRGTRNPFRSVYQRVTTSGGDVRSEVAGVADGIPQRPP
jgi:hypothetical protein